MGMKIGTDGVSRITVSIEKQDVDLLDRLAALEGSNRSEQLRNMLESARPMIKATVEALEAANRTRDAFLDQAASYALGDLTDVLPEVERVSKVMLGAMSRLEGAAAARPPSCNTGVTLNPPSHLEPPLFDLNESEDE